MATNRWDLVFDEFDDYPHDALPPMPQGFEDCSWHNDTCPSITNGTFGPDDAHDGPALLVFIDYPNPEQREFPKGKRFTVGRTDQGDFTTALETDDWADVLALIAKEAA